MQCYESAYTYSTGMELNKNTYFGTNRNWVLNKYKYKPVFLNKDWQKSSQDMWLR